MATTRSVWLVVVAVACLGFAAGIASAEKVAIHDDQGIDDSLRPDEGKALIYFVRPQMLGGGIKTKLYADGEFVGIVHRKTFIAIQVDPGTHEFAVVAENAGILDAEVEAGKIYYVQVAMHMGMMKARTHFEVVRDDSEAREEYLKGKEDLRAVSLTDEGEEWVAENKEKDLKKIEKFRDKETETMRPEDGYDEPI